MDKKQFVETVGKPERFSSQDRGWLHAMQAKYPYSSVVSVLALLADRAFHFDTPAQRRATVLAMCNSAHLDGLLSRAAVATEESSFDVLNEINTFQEVSFKTAPKSVILSKFLQASPSEEKPKEQPSVSTTESNDKKSLVDDGSIATETLAVIFEQQGLPDKALAIYRKLLARNPEKSSIFAPRIERLEKTINSK